MDAVVKVNRMFLSKEDIRGVGLIVLCLLARGKATAMLSEVSRKRLAAFTSSGSNFSRAILSYISAVVLLSPMDVLFNELVSRLRMFWSHKLTMAMAKKMLSQKLRSEDDDKNFESLVASEADRFVELQIDLAVEAAEAITHLYFFTQILWNLSPRLGSAGLATAVLGTSASLILGGARLPRLFREERSATGTFSHNLSRCRENLESIQFAKGVEFELSRINTLDQVRQRATVNRKREKDLISMFSSMLRRLAGGVLPSLILRHEHDQMEREQREQGKESLLHSHHHNHQIESAGLKLNATHGGHPHSKTTSSSNSEDADAKVAELAQSTEAFDEILFHLLIVSENFHNATRLVTIGRDICNLLERDDLTRDEQAMSAGVQQLTTLKDDGKPETWLQVSDLTVRVPKSQQILLEKLSFTLRYGDTLLITGASGCGKTALLRVLFGLWPVFGGEVLRPSDARLVALPQKPFCSLGNLAEQVSYPKPADEFSEEAIRNALTTVGLKHLLDRYSLQSIEKWQEQLSVGEQQRLGFSRIVLHRPEFAFFDESSSSLDLESETKMYELVSDIVKGGFVSIGHRRSIERYHLHKLVLYGPQAEGKWKREF